MKEPVDHILRPSLPWRSDAATTECGYDAAKVKALSRDEYRVRLKELGQQRTAMVTCMTCAGTAGRHGAWEDDPRQAIAREIEWEGSGRWSRHERGQKLRDELLAIADLIAAHREEFDASVRASEGRREWLERKDAMTKKARTQPSRPL